MHSGAPAFKKYIFVCENERAEGDCCAAQGKKIKEKLKELVKEKGLSSVLRVSRSGCLDVCAQGPNVLLMPDNIWFNQVSESDIQEIIHVASRR